MHINKLSYHPLNTVLQSHQKSFIHKLEMIQHHAVCFVLNKPWRRNYRDSITEMLQTLKWPSLEKRRKQSRLLLFFKLLNNMIHIPTEYLPVPSPLTNTRSNHN